MMKISHIWRKLFTIDEISLLSGYKKLFLMERNCNLLYGHNLILKNYVDVKLPYIIPGNIQHGWLPNIGIHGILNLHSKKEKKIKYFVWNKRNLEKSVQHGYYNVTAIGAPFIYLPEIRKSSRKSFGSKSLLLFPMHSSKNESFRDTLDYHRKYIKDIKELFSHFKNITVCLYYIQYNNIKLRKLFKENGFSTTTLGHNLYNPFFLYHFKALVNRYEYVSSNVFSSAIFYSLFMKKRVFIYGNPRFQEIILKINKEWDDYNEFFNRYPQLLWKNFNDESHTWIGEKELGLRFKLSPSELKELFGWYLKKLVPAYIHEFKKSFQRYNTRLTQVIRSSEARAV